MTMPSARFSLRLCVLSAALSLAAGAAMAQTGNNPPRQKDGGKAATAAAAPIPATAPNARLAALIEAGGRLVRNKGVRSVTRIQRGVYCILPESSTGIDPAKAIVTATVEYFFTALNEAKVQWGAKGSPCGEKHIAVYTLADLNGNGLYDFSNDVGFSIVVP